MIFPLKTYVFRHGENILKTGITPLHPEGMVHGVEIQWPGIMLLIKYSSNPDPTTLTNPI